MKNNKKSGTGSASVKKPRPLASRVSFLDQVEFEKRYGIFIIQ